MDIGYYNKGRYRIFNKHGRRIPGAIVSEIPIERKKEDPTKVDRENRVEVINIIINLIDNEGMTLYDACKTVAKNKEITDKFQYLFGTFKEDDEQKIENIIQVYSNWYNGKMKCKRPIEKGEI